MNVIKLYLSGWRRMIYVRQTRSGGALLLEPTRSLHSHRLSKKAYEAAHPEAVEADTRWLRSRLREWSKAARKAKRQFASGAVKEVLRAG